MQFEVCGVRAVHMSIGCANQFIAVSASGDVASSCGWH